VISQLDIFCILYILLGMNMKELSLLNTLRRFPAGSQGPLATSETFELAQTLTSRQKSLLAAIVRKAEDTDSFDLIRACFTHPRCFQEDMSQANWVLSRHEDGKLYSEHRQGPSKPTEEMPEGMEEWFGC